eukprot:TRINITY_DN15367_c0_g1_i2.p1 TRINITY_DN15367_c0_g1~~TRINITY_DN15367_c0_g1_i2.p1  ORF type:complete len:749 (+),score=114.56 TRINITY_DN15367_c0_g1_i2:51-2249(+)
MEARPTPSSPIYRVRPLRIKEPCFGKDSHLISSGNGEEICYPATQAYPCSSAQEEVSQMRVAHHATHLEYPETFPATQAYPFAACSALPSGNDDMCVATQAYSKEGAFACSHPADAEPRLLHQPARGFVDTFPPNSGRNAALGGLHSATKSTPVDRPVQPIFPAETQPNCPDIWADCATQGYPMEEALANSRSGTILDVDAVPEIRHQCARPSAEADCTAAWIGHADQIACTQHYFDPPREYVATEPGFSNARAERAGAAAAQDDSREEIAARSHSKAILDFDEVAELQDQSARASADVDGGLFGVQTLREDALGSTQIYSELAPKSVSVQPSLMPAATQSHEPKLKRQRFFEDLAPTQYDREPPMTQVLDCDELLGSSEDEEKEEPAARASPCAGRGGSGKLALLSPQALKSSSSSASLGATPKCMASPVRKAARSCTLSVAPKDSIGSSASAPSFASPSTMKGLPDNSRKSATASATARSPKASVKVPEIALLLPSSRKRQSSGDYVAAKDIKDVRVTKPSQQLGKNVSAASRDQDSALVTTPPPRPHGKQPAQWTPPRRRLNGKQPPPTQIGTEKRSGKTKQIVNHGPVVPEERGRDLLRVTGHTLRPAELGRQVAVSGDGWGCGKGYFVGVVTEADRFTFTVVTSGSSGSCSTGRSEEVHVLREFCALLSPGDPRAEAANSHYEPQRKKSGAAAAEASSAEAATTAALLPVVQSSRGATRAKPKRGKK